jgi:hypothetical protein
MALRLSEADAVAEWWNGDTSSSSPVLDLSSQQYQACRWRAMDCGGRPVFPGHESQGKGSDYEVSL